MPPRLPTAAAVPQYYGLQVKGLKKIDNYKKRQDEVKAYLAACEPEDAEYFVCQNELQERLVASYLEVDRIIGEKRSATGRCDRELRSPALGD